MACIVGIAQPGKCFVSLRCLVLVSRSAKKPHPQGMGLLGGGSPPANRIAGGCACRYWVSERNEELSSRKGVFTAHRASDRWPPMRNGGVGTTGLAIIIQRVHQQVYLHPYPKELMLRNHV
jgi:hypothetical protein